MIEYKTAFIVDDCKSIVKEIIQMDGVSKIIITSADSTIETQALSIGTYKFLDKPFRLETVKEIFNEITEH